MKNKLKIVMTMTIAIIASQVFGQVRIVNSATNSAALNGSAFIDASSNSTTNATNNIGKGLIFPRTDLTTFSAFSGTPVGLGSSYPTRFDGMIVYNTGTGNTLASASDSIVSVTPGYYYYDNKTTNLKGGKWTRIDATSADISKLLVQSPAKDSIINVISSNGKTLSNGNGILINGSNSLAKSVLADASLRIDSTAIAKMIGQSPVKDSVSSAVTTLITSGSISGKTTTAGSLLTVTNGSGAALKDNTIAVDTTAMKTFIADNIGKSPIKDSVSSTVSTVIQSGSVTGQNLTGTGIIVTGGTGTSLKATSLRLDSTAIAKMATQSPMKDSIISSASSSITSGLISGNNLTSFSGGALVITGGIGTSLKATSIAINKDSIVTSSQVSKVLNTSPAKDSLTKVINNQITGGTITGQNLTAGSLLQTTGTPTGAALKAAGYQVDTTALKTFVASNIGKSPIKDSVSSTVSTIIQSGSVTGQNTTAGNLITVIGGSGASLKMMTIAADTAAMKTFIANNIGKSPIKDSVSSTVSTVIQSGSITGQNLTAGSLLQTTGTPTGASLKVAGYQVDTTAMKSFIATNIGKSPIKDSVSSTVNTVIQSGSVTGQNLTAGTLLQTTGTPTGASLKAAGYQVDTTALKTFMNGKVQNSVSAPLTGNGTSASPLTIGQNGASTGQILTWNGSAWVPQNPGSGADNWGTQTAAVSTLLSGNGTSVTPVRVDTTALKTFISNTATSGALTGQNLTAGSLLQTTGTPTGASLKAAGYQVDTAALKTFISNTATSGSITGQNTTAGSLITVTNGSGASLKAMTVAADTNALKTFISNTATSGAITGQNLTAGSLLQTTGTSTGASLKAAGYQVDTIALKTFMNGKVQNSVSAPLTGNGTSASPLTIGQNGASTGQILTWNGSAWVPQNPGSGADNWGTQTAAVSTLLSGNGTSVTPVRVDTTALKTFISNTATSGALTGQNLTAGSLLQMTGTPTGASLKAVGYQVDTTALKTFVAGRTTNTLSSSVNTMTNTTNGISATAPIVNSVANAFNTTNRQLTTTINGVAGTAVTLTDGADSTTASNGLTMTGKDIRLGGTLTAATTIAQAGNNISFTGTGNVGIGTSTPSTKLDIPSGEARVGSSTGSHTRIGSGYVDFYNASGVIKANIYADGPGNLYINAVGTSTSMNTFLNNSSGNVSIGNSSPTEKLDVTGNVKFSGALMPNNTAGTAGQVLTSAGAGAAPTWVAPSSTISSNTLTAASNAITNTTNGVSGTLTPAAGTLSTKFLGFDAAGNLVTDTALTAIPATIVSNTSSANNLTTTVNGITGAGVSLINSNTLTSASNSITSTVNGVAAVLTPAAGGVVAENLGFNSSGTLVRQTHNVANTPNIYSQNGTTGAGRAVGITDNLTFDGGTLYVDGVNDRVGIGATGSLPGRLFVSQNAGNTTDLVVAQINNCGGPCGQGTARNFVLANSNGSNSLFASLDFVPSSTASNPSGAAIVGIERDPTNHYAGLGFFTRNAGGFADRMVITSPGNVGIGIGNPTEKLDVTGNVKFSGALMPNNTAGTTGQVLTSAGAGVAPTWAAPVGDGDAWGVTGENQTANVGRTGNVGIGTVAPNANAKLDVSSTNQGILVPRVNLTSTTLDLNGDGDANIANQPVGLLVYNTGTALDQGFYSWSGSSWSAVGSKPSGVNVYVNNNDPNSASTFDDVTPVVTNDNSLKANTQNTYYGADGSVWVWNGTAYVTKSNNINLNVGQMASTFRTFAAGTPANTYPPTSGLIELDGIIRLTSKWVNSTYYATEIQNISGASINVTYSSLVKGVTLQVGSNVSLAIANGAYKHVESDGLTLWGTGVFTETLECNIVLPNGRWYQLEWTGYERAGGSKIVYMQATRKF